MQHHELRRRVVDEPHDVVRGNLIKTLVDGWPEDPETRSLLEDLVHVDGSEHNRAGVAKLLASRWPDERTCEALRQVVTTDPQRSVVLQAGLCLRELRPVEALSWTHEQLRSPDPDMRIRALSTLRTTWEDHPDTRTALHAVVTTDDEPRVRLAALSELGDLSERDPAFQDVARDRLAHDSSPVVRHAALEALDVTADPNVFDLVRTAGADADPAVRAAAARHLGLYGRSFNTDAARQALYEQVTTDEDPDAREAALRAMARMQDIAIGEPLKRWPDRPEAITWLREYVAADPIAQSRRSAVDLLGDYVDDPDNCALLHRIAERHPDESGRIEAIIPFYRREDGDPDTMQVMLRLAETDPSSHVRKEAAQVLNLWSDDFEDFDDLDD